MIVLALLLAYLLPFGDADPLGHLCGGVTGGDYTAQSTYGANLELLPAALRKNASSGLFTKGSVGAAPHTVYGLGLCRGDASACGDCIGAAFGDVQQACPVDRDARALHEKCVLSYSSHDFASYGSNATESLLVVVWPDDVKVKPMHPGNGESVVSEMIDEIAMMAAYSLTTARDARALHEKCVLSYSSHDFASYGSNATESLLVVVWPDDVKVKPMHPGNGESVVSEMIDEIAMMAAYSLTTARYATGRVDVNSTGAPPRRSTLWRSATKTCRLMTAGTASTASRRCSLGHTLALAPSSAGKVHGLSVCGAISGLSEEVDCNLNYPSMVVVFDSCTHMGTLTRTVTKVSEQASETYKVTVTVSDAVKEQGVAAKEFTVTLDPSPSSRTWHALEFTITLDSLLALVEDELGNL
uniref:Uncharacterized protein n=1 Tax=Aegilops tauschii TaxID=37682 RepID=M8B754_AEGTA